MRLFPVKHKVRYSTSHPSDVETVSIIIASYKYGHVVRDTLDSILAQTYPSIELVVVDDCSPDVTVQIIEDWMQKNGSKLAGCLLVQHLENQGLAQTRNTAVSLTSSASFFVLDSDNMLHPRCIERHKEVLQRANAAGVYAISELFDEGKGLGPADIFDRDRLAKGPYIDAMALISKQHWEDVGGYSHFNTMGWEDYDLWCKFCDRDLQVIFIPEILTRYRVHMSSMNNIETGPRGRGLHMEMATRHLWMDYD